MITLGKRDSLHARRQAAAFLMTPDATKKLFADLAPRFADRPGGYTRIIRTGWRIGDGAELAILEFIGSELKKKEKKPRKAAAEEAPEEKEEKEAVAAKSNCSLRSFPRSPLRKSPGSGLFLFRRRAFCARLLLFALLLRTWPHSITSAATTCAAMPPLVSISTSPTAAVRPGTNDW